MGGGTAGRIGLGVATGGGSEAARALGYGKGPGGGQSFEWGAGMPQAPQFQSLRDQSGLLGNKNLRLDKGQDITMNTQGLEEIRKRALGTGPSAWAQMAQQKAAGDIANQRSAATASGNSAQAQARAGLASHGGLRGGAAERLALGGQQNLMSQRQNLASQGAQNNLNIGLQDETQRTELLKGLPGMETQALQPQILNRQAGTEAQKYNIGNALQDKYAQDQAAQTAYQQQMQTWAAKNQADAIAKAGGGKGGVLGTGIGASGGGGK